MSEIIISEYLNTPVVTGIGHEIDFTIADFAADVRANTPTGAVETAVPDIGEVFADLYHMRNRIANATLNRLRKERDRLSYYESRPVMQFPDRLYSQQAMRLDYLREKLMKAQSLPALKRAQFNQTAHALQAYMHECAKDLRGSLYEDKLKLTLAMKKSILVRQNELVRTKTSLISSVQQIPKEITKTLASKTALLDAYSPLKIMSRGYSIALCGDQVIRSANDVSTNDHVRIRLTDGVIHTRVESTEVTDAPGKKE